MGFQPCTSQANVQMSRCVSAFYYSTTGCRTWCFYLETFTGRQQKERKMLLLHDATSAWVFVGKPWLKAGQLDENSLSGLVDCVSAALRLSGDLTPKKSCRDVLLLKTPHSGNSTQTVKWPHFVNELATKEKSIHCISYVCPTPVRSHKGELMTTPFSRCWRRPLRPSHRFLFTYKTLKKVWLSIFFAGSCKQRGNCAVFCIKTLSIILGELVRHLLFDQKPPADSTNLMRFRKVTMTQLLQNLNLFLKWNLVSLPFWSYIEIQRAAVQLRVAQEFPLAQQEVGGAGGGRGVHNPSQYSANKCVLLAATVSIAGSRRRAGRQKNSWTHSCF